MTTWSILGHTAKVLEERRDDYGDAAEQFKGRCQSDAKRSLSVKRPLTRAAPQAMRFCHSARAAERRSL